MTDWIGDEIRAVLGEGVPFALHRGALHLDAEATRQLVVTLLKQRMEARDLTRRLRGELQDVFSSVGCWISKEEREEIDRDHPWLTGGER